MIARRRSGALSNQQMIADSSNAARISAFGESNFRFMRDRLALHLDRYFNLEVVSHLAEEAASQCGYIIDKCSRRTFDALILWIFERWETIGDLFVQNVNNYLQHAAGLEADGRRVDSPGIEMVEPGVNQEASTNAGKNDQGIDSDQ